MICFPDRFDAYKIYSTAAYAPLPIPEKTNVTLLGSGFNIYPIMISRILRKECAGITPLTARQPAFIRYRRLRRPDPQGTEQRSLVKVAIFRFPSGASAWQHGHRPLARTHHQQLTEPEAL